MPTIADFTVPADRLPLALRVCGDALRGRGFTVVEEPAGALVASRGSRVLTILLGGLVPAARHYLRYRVETVDGDRADTALVRLVEHDRGVAVADGAVETARRGRARRWAADGIEAALVAAGVLLDRLDHG